MAKKRRRKYRRTCKRGRVQSGPRKGRCRLKKGRGKRRKGRGKRRSRKKSVLVRKPFVAALAAAGGLYLLTKKPGLFSA